MREGPPLALGPSLPGRIAVSAVTRAEDAPGVGERERRVRRFRGGIGFLNCIRPETGRSYYQSPDDYLLSELRRPFFKSVARREHRDRVVDELLELLDKRGGWTCVNFRGTGEPPGKAPAGSGATEAEPGGGRDVRAERGRWRGGVRGPGRRSPADRRRTTGGEPQRRLSVSPPSSGVAV